MQAFSSWAPPGGVLGRLVAAARERVAGLSTRSAELERIAASAAPAPSLADALRAASVTVIAEIKRRSPSRGAINPTMDAATRARRYVEGGASALSVLTEPTEFGGSTDDLIAVCGAVAVPLLRKDFHVAPVQLAEARALGASAALLIVRALAPDELPALVRTARELGLETLVEVRDERELDRALDAGARIIGVNSRDLETLEVDARTPDLLLPRIPPDVVAVHESGVKTRADVERAASAGADAVLVGSALSSAPDGVHAVRLLTGVASVGRG